MLDLLLALDSIDRKIGVHLSDTDARKLLRNNFLTQQYSKITVFDSVLDAMQQKATILVLDSEDLGFASLEKEKLAAFDTVFLIKGGTNIPTSVIKTIGFAISEQSDNFIALRKKEAVA